MAPVPKLPVTGNPKAGVMASSQAMAASSKALMGSNLPTTHLRATASRVNMAAAALEEVVAVVSRFFFSFPNSLSFDSHTWLHLGLNFGKGEVYRI